MQIEPIKEQAETKVGQAQINLGLGFNSICIWYIELIKKQLATLSATNPIKTLSISNQSEHLTFNYS